MELNPFDRPALEMALSLVREYQGEITVVSMGPQNATFGLYQAMAMGADRSILICDPALKESDTYITAKVLGTAIKRLHAVDMVLFGTRSSDSDTGHVGPQTAVMLGFPFVGNIHQINLVNQINEINKKNENNKVDKINKVNLTAGNENVWKVENDMDGYMDTFEIRAPAVFSVSSSYGNEESGATTSLYGIEDAFEKTKLSSGTMKFWNLNPMKPGLELLPQKLWPGTRQKKSNSVPLLRGHRNRRLSNWRKHYCMQGLWGNINE
ncbi:hypothetical protein MTBBW1_80013 [Desulfamplus magnetovallimortis]|uniref:Electron transfer flavoprotein alpha/beta-subunit N-terminal domain-containing protein n=1 Tax=Desulfamplus magnetovallimortis TaxID=1246637 RepID=L0R416_9BACT|nr:hypothetical protein [Desulfamplus magnetovallimortis]CCO06624.1 hypothetical protein DEMABW1_80013 [Desulfamplus magnetovallimortis BW-1]SLM32675.1 hypothetical protein MTBBW1_80013 [Desulfamplus magnetovallimortis]